MRFTSHLAPEMTSVDDVFYCRAKRRELALASCLDGYVDANAFEKRRSACFRCPYGRRNREAFAASFEQGALV